MNHVNNTYPRLQNALDEELNKKPLLEQTSGARTAEATLPPRLSGMLVVRLCLVGFLCNCQPSEPFLASYLLDDKVGLGF